MDRERACHDSTEDESCSLEQQGMERKYHGRIVKRLMNNMLPNGVFIVISEGLTSSAAERLLIIGWVCYCSYPL